MSTQKFYFLKYFSFKKSANRLRGILNVADMDQHKMFTSGIKSGILPSRAALSSVVHGGKISNKSLTLCHSASAFSTGCTI